MEDVKDVLAIIWAENINQNNQLKKININQYYLKNLHNIYC